MNKNMIPVIAALAVVLVGGAVFVAAPLLQDDARIVNVRADENSERARRLLARYDANMERLAEARRAFAQVGVSERLEGASLEEVIDNLGDFAQTELEAEGERLKALLETTQRARADLDARFAELDPSADPGMARVNPFSKSPAGMARDMSTGLRERDALIRENETLLAQALEAADAAIAEMQGAASGADNLHANRIKGIVQYHQALAGRRGLAPLLRREATAIHRLARTGAAIRAATDELDHAQQDDVRAQIDIRKAEIAKHSEALAAVEHEIADLEDKVALLEGEIVQQDAIRDEARAKMEALEDQGLQYEFPDAAERFRAEYERHAAAFRDAVSAAHRLRYGSLVGARIDESGDFVKGRFVPDPPADSIGFERGLDEYERGLRSAAIKRAGFEQIVADQIAVLDHLKELESRRSEHADDARDRLAKLIARAGALYETYHELAQDILQQEDAALRKLRQAEASFNSAQRVAQMQINDVPQSINGVSQLPIEDPKYSPAHLIKDDRWLPAQMKCQTADAKIQAALIQSERFNRLTRALDTLDEVAAFTDLAGFDPGALADERNASLEEGVMLIDDAISALERSSRDPKKHWSVVATAAGAYYAKSLFADEPLIKAAIRNYQAVVQAAVPDIGQDCKDCDDCLDYENCKDCKACEDVWPYVERLEQLRNRRPKLTR